MFKECFKVLNFCRTIIFGFVTSEGKKKETAVEESTDETNPLLKPKTFTEVRWLKKAV